MGMDVYGKNPTAEVGMYFSASIWGWHPLAELMAALAPTQIGKITHLHTNDGDGLDAADSILLADALYAATADGQVLSYLEQREAYLAALPQETCNLCAGTGTRTDSVGVDLGMADRKWCNGCEGSGTHEPLQTWSR